MRIAFSPISIHIFGFQSAALANSVVDFTCERIKSLAHESCRRRRSVHCKLVCCSFPLSGKIRGSREGMGLGLGVIVGRYCLGVRIETSRYYIYDKLPYPSLVGA